MFTHYGFGHHYQPITSSGVSCTTARYVTGEHARLQANQRQFFRALTFEQKVAKAQAARVEQARAANEHTVNGLILADGGEW